MKKKLYLVFDADTAGQSAAQKVWATRLGKDKCWNIVLPDGEDVNSYFLKHTKEDFDLLIKEAHLFKVEGIMSLGDAIHEIYKRSQENDESGFLLPWDNVNRLISNGVNRRDLVIIGGPGNVGKTSLTLQIMDNFVEVYNVPSLYFCLEMPETALATKIIQLREDMVYNEVAPSDVLSYYDKLKDLPMYFGYSARVTPELFYNTVREVRNRYGVGLVIFDNIQLMIRSGEEKDLSQASKLFKNMAMDLDIVVIMISQPRKLNSESSNITYDDLKGTSAFSQDADIILLMHRKRSLGEENTFSFAEKTTVIADKVRLAGGGRTKLKFIGAKSKFVEYEKGEE